MSTYYDHTWGENTGEETRKSWQDKWCSGFFTHYMGGSGLDVGGTGYLENIHAVLPDAVIVDLDYPGYDGRTLPFEDGSLDYVYSSHCLEHIEEYKNAIQDWYRVTKKGGHIIIVVPNRFLYEKKDSLPSRWNADHKRFYTPASLLSEIEESLPPNSFRVRNLQDNDTDHDYSQPDTEHSKWMYETEVVIQKL